MFLLALKALSEYPWDLSKSPVVPSSIRARGMEGGSKARVGKGRGGGGEEVQMGFTAGEQNSHLLSPSHIEDPGEWGGEKGRR